MIELKPHSTGQPTKLVERRIKGLPVRLSLDLNKASQRYMFDILTTGQWYEQETVEALANFLKPGHTFFDIGAHCGYFSAIAGALVGDSGRVLAFEPMPENAASFRRNCPKARLVEEVVADCEGPTRFYRNSDNDGGSALWPVHKHPFNTTSSREPVTLEQTTLDTFQSWYPNAIKIDTEGAECRVLAGAKEILKQPQLKLVICEVHHFGLIQLGDSPGKLFQIMRSFGFRTDFNNPNAGAIVDNAIFFRD